MGIDVAFGRAGGGWAEPGIDIRALSTRFPGFRRVHREPAIPKIGPHNKNHNSMHKNLVR